MKPRLAFAIICGVALSSFTSMGKGAENVGLTFDEWVEEFRRDAVENGISAQSLDMAFRQLNLEPSVISLDRKQPEFRKDFQTYIDSAINDARIKKAQKLLRVHAALFKEIEEKYGVPANYLAAFWGMETNFGKVKGSYPMLNVLATLAYDTRRSAFFRSELMHGVKMVQEGVNPEKMIGSWAGAGGNFQFMPSTFHSFGVDYDNDGQIDLWDNLFDAMASAANYLSREGWNKSVGWGGEVSLPKRFDWTLIEQKKTLAQWRDLGIEFIGKNLNKAPSSQSAELFIPAGVRGPAFLVFSNFRVILKWNNSVLYAVAVGHLADRIAGSPQFSRRYYSDGKPFSVDDAVEVQELLQKMNMYDGEKDGVLGRKSREAVRRFQSLYDLPSDGYANASLLHFMRLVLNGGIQKKGLKFDEIIEMQKILSKGSYYIGPADGKMGAATKKGLELYKKVYGLTETELSTKLLQQMRVQYSRNLENGEMDPLVKEYQERERQKRAAESKKRQEMLKNKKSNKNKKLNKLPADRGNTAKTALKKRLK